MSKISVDTARLPLLLHELRLPAINRLWQDIAARADKEGWPAIRFLSALAELEVAERARRRIEGHLAESRLPSGARVCAIGRKRVIVAIKGIFCRE
jgi:hypothetical protein